MFQDKSKGQGVTDALVSSGARSVAFLHFVPEPRSMAYLLEGQELKASIISRDDGAQMEKVLELRERLFGHYHIPGSSRQGDRDEFDGEPTFHVLLECSGEPVGVARLQPVSTRDGLILPHLAANFSLFDPSNAYHDPRQVIDMSRVDVVPNAPTGSFEVLVAACLDLSSASGFSSIVAFTPRGIGDYMKGLGVPYEVLSGARCHVAHANAAATGSSQEIELIITSFSTGHEIAEKFLGRVGATVLAL